MTYLDDTLKSYLDGDLPKAEFDAIEQALSTDEVLQRRVMALDTYAAPVAAAFEDLPGSDRLDGLRASLPDTKTESPSWLTGAAMAASVAFGVLLGSQFLPMNTVEPTNWRMEIARYQALYVPETVAFIDQDSDDLVAELDRASNALGLDLALEVLAEIDDLKLRRAQVLGFEGRPLIQLAYTDAKGVPFALCIMPGGGGEDGSEMLAGLATHTWGNGSHGFILLGGDQQDKISNLAERLKAGALKSL